jgi:hypothetical protein
MLTDPRSSYFESAGITLLNTPKIALNPGEIYLNTHEGNRLHDIGDLADIIVPRDIKSHLIFKLPSYTEQPIEQNIKNLTTVDRNVNGSFSLLKRLFEFLNVAADVTVEKLELVSYDLISVNYVEIKPAKLEKALENFVLLPKYYAVYNEYYVVTHVYSCDKFQLSLSNVDSKSAGAIVKASELVDSNFGVDKSKKNSIVLQSDKKIKFGIKVAKINYDRITKLIEMEPLSLVQSISALHGRKPLATFELVDN